MIVFKRIHLENFLSIGNKGVDLTLNTHKITCVSGNNGSSKSAICVDGIYYALYGKSFRKTNLQKMVNSINKKGLLVELEFSIEATDYKIVRGMKPNIFEIYINGELKKELAARKDYQEYLTNIILKMNEKTFRQLVVIGSSSYIPFMQLSSIDRRNIVEELLQIDIFSGMSAVAKKMLSETDAEVKELSHELEKIQIEINTQKKNSLENIKRLDDNIEKKKYFIEQTTIEGKNIRKKYDEESEKLKDFPIDTINDNITSVRNNFRKIEERKIGVEYSEKENRKLFKFFSENEVCPTCKQTIEERLKEQKISECEAKTAHNQSEISSYSEEMLKFDEQLEKLNEEVKRFNTIKDKLNSLKNQMKTLMSNIKVAQKDIEGFIKEKESIMENHEVSSRDSELEDITKRIDALEYKKNALQFIISLLKDDGVKSIVIKNYIPILNSLIKKYLNIINYDIGFELNETFDENISETFKEDMKYYNLSEGERKRIDQSIIFAMRDIAKMQSSVSCNLLILDESDSGTLDDSGLVAFSDILKSMDEDTNIFIISHSTDYYATISNRNFIAKKVNNFSRLEEC